jgi:hypothetical protein
MGGVLLAVLIGVAVAYWLRQAGGSAASPPTGGTSVQVTLPPILLQGGDGDGQIADMLGALTPTVRPTTNPPGWSVEWPSIQLPTGYGGAAFQLPPTQLPLVPYAEAQRLAGLLRPQVVQTDQGLGVQISTTLSV